MGVGLDADGHPWVNNYGGNVMKVDKTTGVITKTAQQDPGLYTYSDFTGYQLRNYTAPKGSYTRVFEGCAGVTNWKTLEWSATVPDKTKLQVYIRTADTLAGLSDSGIARQGPFMGNPADLKVAGVPSKRFLKVFFEMTSQDGQSTPILKGFSLKWDCEMVFQ